MPELAFFTTAELIDELLSRHTFLGVVVHSAEHRRNNGLDDRAWHGDKQFKVHFNDNLSPPEAARLLAAVSDRIDLHC
jgi:hypothetical protein